LTSAVTEQAALAATPRIALLYAARALRGFGDGFAIIILPAYMTALGYDPIAVGIVATSSLLGTALLTLAVGMIAPRFDLRTLLLWGAGLIVATGLAFPAVENLALIVVVAFIGSINPSSGDLGMLVPLEHAMLARSATDQQRTPLFARYSLIGALTMAAGSLAASAPDALVSAGVVQLTAFKSMFYLYAALGLASAVLYRALPHARAEEQRHAPLGPSRRTVYKLAALDQLTGLYNRRSGEQRLAQEISRAQRHVRPLTVLLMDLDGLKQINDRHGHAAGDMALKGFAVRLQRAIRGSDLAVRLGGDEFMAILPECRSEEVRHVLARVEGLEFDINDEKIRPQFSRGWTDYKPGESPQELLDRADQALYANKRAGKQNHPAMAHTQVPHPVM